MSYNVTMDNVFTTEEIHLVKKLLRKHNSNLARRLLKDMPSDELLLYRLQDYRLSSKVYRKNRATYMSNFIGPLIPSNHPRLLETGLRGYK